MKKLITILFVALIANVIFAQMPRPMNNKPVKGIAKEDALRIKPNSHFAPFMNVKIANLTKKTVKTAKSAVLKSVTISAGGLSSALTANEKTNVTNLTIAGTIDARDFKIMRDSMPALSSIDISTVKISAYIGAGGTSQNSTSTQYPVNEIPEYAFFIAQEGQYNTLISSIQLPSSITSIGSTAFALCSALSSINLSASVISIGETVFTGSSCYITVDANNPKFSSTDGVLFDKTKTSLIQCPTSKAGSYTIPSTVSTIGLGAFYACSTLTSVIIPSSVNVIGGMSFYNCSGLTSIYVNSPPVILNSNEPPVFMMVNFTNCILNVPYGAKSLYVAASQWSDFVNIIENSQGFMVGANTAKIAAVNGSSTTVDIKANVSWSVASNQTWLAFSPSSGTGNVMLTFTAQANTSDISRTATVTVSSSGYASQTITVTQGVLARSITVTAGGLSKILTPVGLNSYSNLILKGTIDARDFKVMRDSMPLLTDLDLSGVSIAAYTGSYGTSNYNTQYSADQIPQNAFFNSNTYIENKSLSIIILPSTTKSIDSQAFYRCSALTSVTIPAGVLNIGYSAFAYCTGVKSVTIPNSVLSIESSSFSNCSSLYNVLIPASVNYIGIGAFSYCSALTAFTVQPSNLNYLSENGVLYNIDKTTIIVFPPAKSGDFVIPSSVVIVKASTFNGCAKITSITIPDAVISMGGDTATFSDCKSLTTFIVQPGNKFFTSTDGVLFNKDKTILIQCPEGKIGAYSIPNTTTLIKRSAFSGCNKLTSIVIPNSVTEIGNYAFEGCYGLTAISVNSSPIDLTNIYSVFSGINTNSCTLYVPYGTKALYQVASQWKNFKNIVENSQGFLLDTNAIKLDAKAGSNAKVSISANVLWNVSSDQTWLTVSPTYGSGNGSLTITAQANPINTSRTAIVTVSANGVTSQTITVLQLGLPKIITLTAGGLSSSLTKAEKITITSLQLNGTIDARDFKTMRDSLPLLANLDLSAVNIAAYTGYEGTSNNTDYPANVIPECAFYNSNTWTGKSSLTSVIIPNSAVLIGSSAFNNCNGLTSFTIGNSLSSFDSWTFNHCSALTTFIVQAANPNYSTIDGVLYNKNQTSLLQCPAGKKGVYTISNTVTSIGDNAFGNCNQLTDIIIGSAVTTIGEYAFQNCDNIKSFNIPNAVTIIGIGAFSYCSFTQFTVQSGNTSFSFADGVLFNKNKTTLIQNILYIQGDYIIPSTVTTISGHAFEGSRGLIGITIPNTVTSIGDVAFYSCDMLKSIRIPKSVNYIGNYAFAYCYSLDSIFVYATTPLNLSSVSSVFTGVNKSTCTLFVPLGSKALYAAANQWSEFTNIVEIQPVSKTINISIAGSLSTALTSDLLSTISKLTITGTIDARDFKTLRDLMPLMTNLDISGANIVTYTGTAGTYSSNYTVYPANEIPADAFYNPNNGTAKVSLTSVILPLSATSIGNYAFQRCSGLTGVFDIPSLVTNIGSFAFYYCTKLTSVNFPAGLATIGNNALYGCSAITSINIPSSVTTIGSAAFSYCNMLAGITVQSGNTNFSSADGVLFNKNQSTLLQCPGAKAGSYIIPGTVTSIGDYAFNYCSKLTSVTIPSSVTNIGNYAFYSCNALTSITLPATLTTIGSSAFSFCGGITSISIPASVTSIGIRALSSCTKLTAINVESANVNYMSLDGVLFNKNQSTIIQYPNGKAGVSYSIPATVTSIGDYTFYNCSVLTSITLPASVTSIGTYAFSNCNKLTSINIPSSVTSIGNYAFNSCTGLASIYVNSKPLALLNTLFLNVNTTTCTLYVPYSTKTLYSTANYWNSFVNITELPTGFVLDVNSLNVPATAGSSNVNITANIAWVTITDKTWLAVSPSSGSGNNILSLIVQANTSDISRTATVTVSAIGVTSQTITVTQAGVAKNISVTAGNLSTTLTVDQLNGISDLTISGTIDARDFKTMRDKMPLLAKLDISNVNIVTYSGLDGTVTNTSATYPENTIPDYAFSLPVTYTGKTSLKNIVFPNSITAIGNTTFENCTGLTGELIIPSSVTSIGNYAFYGCSGFTSSLNIPTMVNFIGSYAFAYCSGFNGTLNIPSMLTSISNYTFIGCSSLTGSLIIPSSVTSIGESAFGLCSSLTSVSIPWSVSIIGLNSFRRTNIMFSVDYNNQNYSSIDGVLFDKNQNMLIQCPASKTGSYIIPSTVNSIGSGAFDYCKSLTSVSIPASVNSIGSYAFYYCSGLTSIYANATIPVDLSLMSSVFLGVNTSTCILYVPVGSKSLYEVAVQWKDFANIVEFATGVQNVSDAERIQIYPNPVTDGFRINGLEGSATLLLMDISGKIVLNKQVYGNENISVSTLKKGVYIVKLISNEATFEQKVIKN